MLAAMLLAAMLKDSQLLTLKAFLAAYAVGDRPDIPELAAIRADLAHRVGELEAIARQHPQLSANYQQARQLLTDAANTRKAGTYAIPEPPPNDTSTDVENLARVLDQKTEAELQADLPTNPPAS